MSYFPYGFPYGTGYGSDNNNDSATGADVTSKYFCADKGHLWADTGMKWTYCKSCDAEGMWDMLHGYQISDRNRAKS